MLILYLQLLSISSCPLMIVILPRLLRYTAQVITFINHILHVGRISVTCIFLQCCGIVGRRHQVLCWVPGEEEELAKLFERLNKASTAYGKEISAEKTKLMTNNISGINTEIKINGQKLETLTSFKYLGSVITDEGPKPEILSRTAQTTAALTRLKPVWNDRSMTDALPCHIHLPVCL